MTLKEILEEKEQRLESVPDDFASKTEQVQKETLKRAIALLDSLERQGGNIVLNEKNLAKIQEITDELTR